VSLFGVLEEEKAGCLNFLADLEIMGISPILPLTYHPWRVTG
jgi:hypothetical protein